MDFDVQTGYFGTDGARLAVAAFALGRFAYEVVVYPQEGSMPSALRAFAAKLAAEFPAAKLKGAHVTRVRRLILLLCAMVALAAPQTALAAGPMTTPETIVTESFESSPSVTYTTAPYTAGGGLTPGYWARAQTVVPAHSGLWSLWCDGTNANQVTAKQYAQRSGGYATFPLPQSANYYRPVATFYYSLPSRGRSDYQAFSPIWTSDAESSWSWASAAGRIGMTSLNEWVPLTIDLTDYYTGRTGESLSRAAGTFGFAWQDVVEIDPIIGAPFIHVGQGPSVDDLTVSGWKYGPARSFAATTTPFSTTLTWSRPWRSTAATSTEERPLSFRVWRASRPVKTWTELTTTTPRPEATGDSFTFTDTTVAEATSYAYAVQTWTPGTSVATGYGESVQLVTGPSTSILAPLGNTPATSLGTGVVSVNGVAQPGNGVPLASTRVTITAVRVPMTTQYWNGSAWQSKATSVTPGGTLRAWSTTFQPRPFDDHRWAYMITSRVTDAYGLSSSDDVVVYADNVPPRIVSARSLGLYGLEIRFSERPFAVPALRRSFRPLWRSTAESRSAGTRRKCACRNSPQTPPRRPGRPDRADAAAGWRWSPFHREGS